MKQNLRALIESIVVEALEEWMDECDMRETNSDNARSFGNGTVEKSKKSVKKKNKKA